MIFINRYDVYIVDKYDIGGNLKVYANSENDVRTLVNDYIYDWQLAPAAVMSITEVEHDVGEVDNPYRLCTHENFAKLLVDITKNMAELMLMDDENIPIVKFIVDNNRRLVQYAKESILRSDRVDKRTYDSIIDGYIDIPPEHIDYSFSREDLNEVMKNLREACLELKLSMPNITYVDKMMDGLDRMYIEYAAKTVYNYRRE